MTIFWDLDGPILDVSERYWLIHRDILDSFKRPWCDRRRYWDLKREGFLESDVLETLKSADMIIEYRKRRHSIIERKDLLSHDVLQDGALECLKRSQDNVLVTLRYDRENLLWQLDRLGIERYFKEVLSSGEDKDPRWKIKYDLINDFLGPTREKHVLITDTDTDLRSGRERGMFTVGISNGIRGRDILKKEGPDLLLENTSDLLEGGILDRLIRGVH